MAYSVATTCKTQFIGESLRTEPQNRPGQDVYRPTKIQLSRQDDFINVQNYSDYLMYSSIYTKVKVVELLSFDFT